MTGIYVTCMSGLIEIFGWDMLLTACGLDPNAFGDVTNRYCSWILQYFEALAECGVNSFVMEPTTDMVYIAEKHGKTHSFVGNADTRILLSGTKEEIQNEVRRCMNIGKKYPGFFMAVGNHIPPNTPVENVLIYLDEYERLSKR